MEMEDVVLIRIGDEGTPRNAAKRFIEKDLGKSVEIKECERLGRHEGGVWRFRVVWEMGD